jgi:PAS domain S-box-containing protein
VTKHPATILFVGSDGPAARAVVAAAAAEPGLTVVHASGSDEARAFAEKNPPDLILAEPELPDGEARDLVAAFPEIPLTLVAEDPEAGPCRRAWEAGALDWVRPRELEARELGRTVARALQGRRLLAARLEAERALRRKEAILEQVSRNTGVGVALISRDFRTLWANEQLTRVFGDAVGRPCYEVYSRREQVCPECGARRVFETGSAPVAHERKGIDAQGKPVWSQVIVAPLREEGGEVAAAVELFVPIDDRKRAEAALRESETRYGRLSQEFNAVLDAIPDNLTLQSPDLRILWANRGAAENLGLAIDDLVGRHCYEVWRCGQRPCEKCPVRRCFDTGVPALECVVTPEGRAWELRAVPLRGDDGEVVAVVEVGREVTAHRRAELEREELIRRLERKNVELEQFTHTVSHDLKSPLTTIRGFATLLLRELDEGKVDGVRSYGAKIAAAGQRMQQLLDELLELSRAGRLTGTFEPVPLGEVVQEALANLAGSTSQRQVSVQVAPELPIVRGDRVRLREVIENLVGNAVKFLGEQPSPRVEVGVRAGPAGTVFFVRDNGIGIDAEDRRAIFGLFRKLDPDSAGTGVGLAVVKRIVEVHGGAVWVESQGLGTGSTFCFTLGRWDEGQPGGGGA